MNILYIVPYPPSLVRVRPYQLIRSLHRNGHKVSLLTVYANRKEREDAQALAKAGIHVRAFPLSTSRSLLNSAQAYLAKEPMQARFSWQPHLAETVKELIGAAHWQEVTFDIVHVEHLRGVRFGLAAKKAISSRINGNSTHPPVIWDSVDCISQLFEQVITRSPAVKSRMIARLEIENTRKYEAWAASQFEQVLVTSPTDYSAFLALPGAELSAERITVLPNGVDLEYFTPGYFEDREPATLLVSGKMSYHANVAMVIRLVRNILPLIRAEIPGIKVIVAGKDPPMSLQKLGSEPGITVTGTVPDLRPYLHQAALAVVPLSYGTGIQNKVLEAMACATPVIASRQATSALCAFPGRDLLVAEDDVIFARTVVDLINNPVRRLELGSAGRRYVEQYHSWDEISKRLEQVYISKSIHSVIDRN